MLCQMYKPTFIEHQISKNVNQHTGGKSLSHGGKYHSDNRLQSMESPYGIVELWIQIWHKVVRYVQSHMGRHEPHMLY